MVNIIGSVAVDLVAGMTGEFLALRTTIHLFVRVEREVGKGEGIRLGMGSRLEAFLLGKAWIAFAELEVGDARIDLFLSACSQAVERMIAAVGGQLLALKIGFTFSEGGDVFFAPVSSLL
jgi:hypothetical protein